MSEKTVAQIIREKSQIPVDLPVAGERVYIRALQGWEMLAAGLKPLMVTDEELANLSQQELKDKWAEIVTQARYVAVAVGIFPEYTLRETLAPNSTCVKDLEDQDVIAIYRRAITKTDSRAQGMYYGLNKKAFKLAEHLPLFNNQKEMSAWFYELCHFHFPGLSPFELLNAPEWQIGVLQEMVREGNAKYLKDNPSPEEGSE
jgi:hypothetical protein